LAAHAFLWTRGSEKAQDLGVLDGDSFREAFGINARGQVVGVSFGGPHGSYAFLWENRILRDLNTLVTPGSSDILRSAQDINDAGQITGRVFEPSTGKTITFLATPVAQTP